MRGVKRAEYVCTPLLKPLPKILQSPVLLTFSVHVAMENAYSKIYIFVGRPDIKAIRHLLEVHRSQACPLTLDPRGALALLPPQGVQ